MKKLAVLGLLVLNACGPHLSNGDQGVPGVAGPAPKVTTSPATAQECPTGGTVVNVGDQVAIVCNGVQGLQGNVGATGATGSTGATGAAGQDITPVKMIEFCPGIKPVYPSNFPEYGMCIGNTMYGVYSANDGFLALLPPGRYSSNGINASCTFTIGANCAISY